MRDEIRGVRTDMVALRAEVTGLRTEMFRLLTGMWATLGLGLLGLLVEIGLR